MTRDEAIEILKDIRAINGTTLGTYAIALGMAIEALKASRHDGCEGCKYTHKDQYEMPCLMCKQSKKDLWERREP